MRRVIGASCVVSAVLGAISLLGTSGAGLGRPLVLGAAAVQSSTPIATGNEARQACGVACHRYPPPEILPAAQWRDTIGRMHLITRGEDSPPGPPGTAGRAVRLPEDMRRLLRFYEANAPAELPAPTPWPEADASGFIRDTFSRAEPPPDPGFSHVRLADLTGSGHPEIIAADMRHGTILVGDPRDATGRLAPIGRVPHPAKFDVTDLDRDGIQDLIVADLGRFLPGDHTDGSVVWLRGDKGGGYSRFSLGGFPRVADVRAADFNGDGKPDLALAAFGWRQVGHIAILENRTIRYPALEFKQHLIDDRPGAIHVIPVDLDDDGHLDLVALISQQYETVMAYINTGDGFTFTPREIYTAPHPNWGSTGIQVVDLDGDGDLDVLFTHGDTFDDAVIKPDHGIMWLENRGTYPFTAHSLADLPGAFRAEAADMDNDGDLDIVACAFIAGGADRDESEMPSLVWLEQVEPGIFERRTLERGAPRYATLNLADMDDDGDIDIIVGTFLTDRQVGPWVEVWENRTNTNATARTGSATSDVCSFCAWYD